jgi:acyl-coenzyme A synthetase/AMP-(fatty) acid ligase
MSQWMLAERITILHMITSILRRFLGHWQGHPALPDLRLLVPGGERARNSDLQQWKDLCDEKVKFATCLGSTECGTIAINPLSKDYEAPAGALPVGKPFSSLNARILREDGTEASANEEGELVIESHYIFRGYLNAEELNHEVISFTKDGKSVYKTGDFGFLDENGILYNAGRRDSRIKVNGNLIELAEIESVLMTSGLIDEVAVLHRPLEPGDTESRLVAFYRSATTDNPEADLAAWLLQRLPRIMLPAKWVHLTVFPETTNGKTDRKSLLKLELSTANQILKSDCC